MNMNLFLIGIILILIDIFFTSDITTFIAMILFSVVFFRCLPFGVLTNSIFTIIFFFMLLILYITVWKKVQNIVINKHFAKDKYKAGVYGLESKSGVAKDINGQLLAEINGDIYAFYEIYPLKNNDKFIVKEVKDGKIVPYI